MASAQDFGVCTPWFNPVVGMVHGDSQLSVGERDNAARLVSDILWVLTNRQWPGVCPRTVRPRIECSRSGYCQPVWRYITGPADRCYRCPAAHTSDTLRLPGPVDAVTQILVDGVVLAASAWAGQGNRVIRIDGKPWPSGNDLTRLPATVAPPGDIPAWSVTYDWGALPPAGGVLAVETLYREVALAMLGSDKCRLMWGANMTSLNRRGVTITFESIADVMAKGLTGIDEVDLWVTVARGGGWRPRKARVIRADMPRQRPVWA